MSETKSPAANEPRIEITRSPVSRVAGVDLAQAPFGTIFSDHMLVAEFGDGRWTTPRIQPYGPIPLEPNISGIHYGISAFEGLKAHRSPAGRPLLFRAVENARRLQWSAARLAMPPVPEEMFLEGVRTLVRLDEAWIPPAGKGALYIRPVLFSIDPSLRVKPGDRYLFIILTAPFGSYFASPVDVLVTNRYARAFPGGAGNVKAAGNYAAALIADQEAKEAGCGAVLWLDGPERRYIEECGVMNVFFVIRGEVLTPPLGGTILPGVTRHSVVTLLGDLGIPVREQRISLEDLFEAHARGELTECFGTGTAAVLSQVCRIRYQDRRMMDLPAGEDCKIGPAIRRKLQAIMTGCEPDPHGWVEVL